MRAFPSEAHGLAFISFVEIYVAFFLTILFIFNTALTIGSVSPFPSASFFLNEVILHTAILHSLYLRKYTYFTL